MERSEDAGGGTAGQDARSNPIESSGTRGGESTGSEGETGKGGLIVGRAVSLSDSKEQHGLGRNSLANWTRARVDEINRGVKVTTTKESREIRQKGIPGLIAGRNIHYQLRPERAVPGIIVDVLDEEFGTCVLQLFGSFQKDGFTLTQVDASYAEQRIETGGQFGTLSNEIRYLVGTWHFIPQQK